MGIRLEIHRVWIWSSRKPGYGFISYKKNRIRIRPYKIYSPFSHSIIAKLVEKYLHILTLKKHWINVAEDFKGFFSSSIIRIHNLAFTKPGSDLNSCIQKLTWNVSCMTEILILKWLQKISKGFFSTNIYVFRLKPDPSWTL